VRRVGYVGVRQRILIVDNEATDREFLANLLEPLGFQLAQAASGQDCLDLIPRFKPHLICMDLAMPGMDGWETIRRLREGGLSDAEIVIISANAFDKGGENEVGMRAEDFITKPVRIDELLDWIGQRLKLEWVNADWVLEPTPTPAAAPVSAWQAPPAQALHDLQELIELGYPRGILHQLDEIAGRSGACRIRQKSCVAWPDSSSSIRCRKSSAKPSLNIPMPAPKPIDPLNSDVVLIIDDIPENLALLHDALDEAGYTVLVATNGESALQRARQSRPDVILLDALMPGMDGFEVARRLKADFSTQHIPIVFMTGLTETEHVVAAFAAGGADYVTKPIRPQEVLARIAAHMQNARQMKQARSALDAFGQATVALRHKDGRCSGKRRWRDACCMTISA
jgi:CheY-like chemotaxis protein